MILCSGAWFNTQRKRDLPLHHKIEIPLNGTYLIAKGELEIIGSWFGIGRYPDKSIYGPFARLKFKITRFILKNSFTLKIYCSEKSTFDYSPALARTHDVDKMMTKLLTSIEFQWTNFILLDNDERAFLIIAIVSNANSLGINQELLSG
jgi:hypothetical protein